jgi:sporulation protein YlmC with PRC-barrel domain
MRNQPNEMIRRTSKIEGCTVRTLGDDKVGTIKDIMLDAETGEVVYAVLAVDSGFLNLDSKYFAIPWSAFSFNSHYDDAFILDVNKEKLENSPGFDKDNWPTGPQTEFINEMNSYYGVSGRSSRSEYSTSEHSGIFDDDSPSDRSGSSMDRMGDSGRIGSLDRMGSTDRMNSTNSFGTDDTLGSSHGSGSKDRIGSTDRNDRKDFL